MRVGIVVGSIREGRKGIVVGEWIQQQAEPRGDAEYVVIDLKSFDVPLLTSPTHPRLANKQYESANVQRWSDAIDACDAFVFVTAEYNHGVPGAFKNAVDSISSEWKGKPVAFASYGSVSGSRAVEQWRQILATFAMYDIAEQLALDAFAEWNQDGVFSPSERKVEAVQRMLDQVVAEVSLRALPATT